VPLKVERGKLVLKLTGDYKKLATDRVSGRVRQLARLIGREAVVEV
jgi:exopolyphosphatase/guanosine-5'-triphosphate,3'-diphosphate pyrophosphatase